MSAAFRTNGRRRITVAVPHVRNVTLAASTYRTPTKHKLIVFQEFLPLAVQDGRCQLIGSFASPVIAWTVPRVIREEIQRIYRIPLVWITVAIDVHRT